MATDTNAVTEQSKEGYKHFCIFFTTSTVVVLAIVALMGIFLL